REAGLDRRGDRSHALGQPLALGTGVLEGQEREGGQEDEQQPGVLPVADPQLEHAEPPGALRSGWRPSSTDPVRREPCRCPAPRRTAGRRRSGSAGSSPPRRAHPPPSPPPPPPRPPSPS